jgi:hypothetical protein
VIKTITPNHTTNTHQQWHESQNAKPVKLDYNCVNLMHYPVRVIALQLEEKISILNCSCKKQKGLVLETSGGSRNLDNNRPNWAGKPKQTVVTKRKTLNHSPK